MFKIFLEKTHREETCTSLQVSSVTVFQAFKREDFGDEDQLLGLANTHLVNFLLPIKKHGTAIFHGEHPAVAETLSGMLT